MKDFCQTLRPEEEVDRHIRDLDANTRADDPCLKYERGNEIYKNYNSQVFKATEKESGKIVVMKVTNEGLEDEKVKRIRGENQLLQMIDSEHVIKAIDIYNFNNRTYLFLDYMDGKELTKVIEGYFEQYSDEFIKYTIWCAAKGLQAMHEKNILHRDIKSDNIFCTIDGKIKIADLGLSVCLTKKQTARKTKVGTNNFISPEILDNGLYSKEVDIWAFGAFIYELGTGEPPFMKFGKQG